MTWIRIAWRAAGLALGGVVATLALPAVVLAHGDTPPPPVWPDVLWAWTLDPLPVVSIMGAGGAYVWLVRRVNRRHPRNRVPAGRHWAAGTALVAAVLALLSPIETYSGVLLTVHMIQHLLIQFVVAPMLLLSAPVTLVLRAAGPGARGALLAILHSRVVRVLTFPLLGWLLFAAVNWGWHLSSGLYDLALEVEWIHVVQHMTMLAAALLFWFPVVGTDPGPWRLPHPVRLFYLFLAMPQNSFLGVAIMNAGAVLYPHYETLVRDWGPEPIVDQQAAGTLMWVWGDITFLVAMLLVIVDWVYREERRNARREALEDAEAARVAAARSG